MATSTLIKTSMAPATVMASSLTARRPARRRQTTSSTGRHHIRSACPPLPLSVEALDLSFASPAPVQVLASLRLHVLSYLADLEARLSLLESPISAESLKSKGESTVEEARAWAKTGLEMLESIRSDVCSHLPELHLQTVPSMEEFVKSHLPDVPHFEDMRAHLPAMPDAVRSRLPDLTISDMCSRLDDVRSSFSDLDFHRPSAYVPTLSEHLQTLQSHLSSVDLPYIAETVSLVSPSANLWELLERVMSSDIVSEISSDIRGGEDMLEKAALEVANAVRRSLNGSRLIHYVDLPEQWRNNRFVSRGYRFIPLRQWPLIITSLFALHNETVNIHTHLIPFVLWSFNLIPVSPFATVSASTTDLPEFAFTSFALLCLFTSALWHTMSGCAHPQGMELCARVDYVGIGWLISASVGTLVYYGFQGHDDARNSFLMVCLLMGVLGSIFPFMDWFNDLKYRCYVTRPGHTHWLDWLGGGSHAIWHLCIVVAISLHRRAMDDMKQGIIPV
ncbi:hypothetical protein PHLCEN_2v7291 [Hermanssonia centrifuga]|uniref:HlyIII-domain-containing protein n=1 Tax=Hermanssonia centrifuga TaxID=98765 RepID=A0A2R6NWZ5_9APHY|nr:hypothetical protein PHLCEN_2v7291 [Hermanssonia centrifuga]